MAGDWRGIPGNEHVFERLTGVIASCGATAFVGAWSEMHPATSSGGYATRRDSGSIDRRSTDELFPLPHPARTEPPMTEALMAELVRRTAAKQALVVVGTGVSLASTGGQRLASWKGLISDGLEECAERGLRDDEWVGQQKKLLEGDLDDLLGVAEQVSRRLGWKATEPCDGTWSAWLRKTVGELHASRPGVIQAIRDLGAPIATLNYDNLLTEVTGLGP